MALLRSNVLEQSNEKLIIINHANARAKIWPVKQLLGKYLLCKPVRPPWGTTAYFVSKQGAADIFKNSWPIATVADWGFDILTIGAKIVVPCVIGHLDEDVMTSTIGARIGEKRLSKFEKLFNIRWITFKIVRIFSVKVS